MTLSNWRERIEVELKKISYNEEDLIKIIHLAEDCQDEMSRPFAFLSEQSQYVQQIVGEFRSLYVTRFNKQPPPRQKTNEVVLETPESRKRTVREIALFLAKPGTEVSDEGVLNELKKRGMSLKANNQTATISTILYGFTDEFEKTEKRGIYRRKINPEQK